MTFPEVGERVTLRTDGGAALSARVLERGPDSVLVAITVSAERFH